MKSRYTSLHTAWCLSCRRNTNRRQTQETEADVSHAGRGPETKGTVREPGKGTRKGANATAMYCNVLTQMKSNKF